MMVAKALDLDVEYIHVEVGDMRTPEMLEVIVNVSCLVIWRFSNFVALKC